MVRGYGRDATVLMISGSRTRYDGRKKHINTPPPKPGTDKHTVVLLKPLKRPSEIKKLEYIIAIVTKEVFHIIGEEPGRIHHPQYWTSTLVTIIIRRHCNY